MTAAIARIDLDDIAEAETPRDDDPRTALVQALLDATPTPPSGADAQAVLDAFATMMTVRGCLIAGVNSPLLGPRCATVDALIAELQSRERAWIAALEQAHEHVGNQLRGVRQVRAYRPKP